VVQRRRLKLACGGLAEHQDSIDVSSVRVPQCEGDFHGGAATLQQFRGGLVFKAHRLCVWPLDVEATAGFLECGRGKAHLARGVLEREVDEALLVADDDMA